MTKQTQLLEATEAAGLNVEQWEDWPIKGGAWAENKPVGIMVHHTAPPVPFPVDNLAGSDQGRIKCNLNVKQDGTVWLVAYGAPNYSSGKGSGVVLEECKAGHPPIADASIRGLKDDTNGNPYFWGIEVDHEGDGSSQTPEALEALAKATHAVADHFGLGWQNIVSHAEWTGRKSDPKWNGTTREAIIAIRRSVHALELGPNGEPFWADVPEVFRDAWSWAWSKGILTPYSQPGDSLEKDELMAFLQRFAEAYNLE